MPHEQILAVRNPLKFNVIWNSPGTCSGPSTEIPETDTTSARFAHSTALYVALGLPGTRFMAEIECLLFLRVSACRREPSSASKLNSNERTVQ